MEFYGFIVTLHVARAFECSAMVLGVGERASQDCILTGAPLLNRDPKPTSSTVSLLNFYKKIPNLC